VNEPLDELYLKWLYGQVASTKYRDPARTYWSLMRQLYKSEFVWIVPNDDNRVEDGRDLRLRFMEDEGIVSVDAEWMGFGCSFLEMLIALAKTLSFETGMTSRFWFWRLLENIGLDSFTDNRYEEGYVDEVVQRVVFRKYARNGHGGLFPLRHADEDQRDIEIWYQLSAYLLKE
jgi:hypothetical protein